MLGGELLCHRFGDDVDVVGRLPVGAYDHPQDRAVPPVGAELGVEAVAVELLGSVVVVLVDLHLAGVDDRLGLWALSSAYLLQGERVLTSARDFLLARGPTLQRPRPLRARSGMTRCRTL